MPDFWRNEFSKMEGRKSMDLHLDGSKQDKLNIPKLNIWIFNTSRMFCVRIEFDYDENSFYGLANDPCKWFNDENWLNTITMTFSLS